MVDNGWCWLTLIDAHRWLMIGNVKNTQYKNNDNILDENQPK